MVRKVKLCRSVCSQVNGVAVVSLGRVTLDDGDALEMPNCEFGVLARSPSAGTEIRVNRATRASCSTCMH